MPGIEPAADPLAGGHREEGEDHRLRRLRRGRHHGRVDPLGASDAARRPGRFLHSSSHRGRLRPQLRGGAILGRGGHAPSDHRRLRHRGVRGRRGGPTARRRSDRHRPSPAWPESLPNAVAIVHPALEASYANQDSAGALVAYKLAWAVAEQFSSGQRLDLKLRQFMLNATSLAAIGTVADVVDLRGENRVLTRFGLQALPESKLCGLRALIQTTGLDGQGVDSYAIGFRLAPVLNAAGRMGHARLGGRAADEHQRDAGHADRRVPQGTERPAAAVRAEDPQARLRPDPGTRAEPPGPQEHRPGRRRLAHGRSRYRRLQTGGQVLPPHHHDQRLARRERHGAGLRPLDRGLLHARRRSRPAPRIWRASAATKWRRA